MAQGIATAVSAEILTGAISPGQRLREVELARRFGTSRGPVREALRTLHAQRLVEYEPNRGAQVTTLSTDDVEQIYEARHLIEQYVTARYRPDDDDFKVLDGIVDRMEGDAGRGDLPALVADDLEFHGHCVRRYSNRHLLATWQQFDVQMGAIFLVAMRHRIVTMEQVPGRHRVILDALRSAHPGRIAQSLSGHYDFLTRGLRSTDRHPALDANEQMGGSGHP
jgi:GntR family transcriptional regulator, gluconate operon transcriptional repressor